jgi:hypothetical protein
MWEVADLHVLFTHVNLSRIGPEPKDTRCLKRDRIHARATKHAHVSSHKILSSLGPNTQGNTSHFFFLQ